MKYIIVLGTPVDGFEYVGPFNSKDEAIEHGENKLGLDSSDWWTAPINESIEL